LPLLKFQPSYVVQYCGAGENTDDYMAHTHCMLENQCYRWAFRIYNTYYSPTTTMIARTRLYVTLYIHCLSCLCTVAGDGC